jgi:hypothetical protein
VPVNNPGTPIIQEEGVEVASRRTLNFIGALITAADDAANGRVNITVAGGGSGSVTTIKEAGAQLGGADIVTLDFGAGFDLTETPDTEINIALDLSEIAAGGELAGTMDAPTVNAIHSGSAHHTKYTDAEAVSAVEAVAALTLSGAIDLPEITPPAAPAANSMRLYVEDLQGFSFLSFKDAGGVVRKIVRDSVFVGYNNSGSTIAAGRIVYASGSDGTVPTLALAKADAAATMPAIGVTIESIANSAFGRVMQVGLLENVNTSAYSAGDVLYVSTTTAGVPTATPPAVPNLRQEIGSVLVDHASTGAIQIVARALFDLADAISAVEGEATLDLLGDVTIDGAKSLSVDVINEKDAAAGVTIDGVLLKDNAIAAGAVPDTHGVTPSAHHTRSHDLEGGSDHSTSSGVDGHIMKQTGATTFAFEAENYNIAVVFNNGASVLATGIQPMDVVIETPGTIQQVTVLGKGAESGSIVIDLWVDTYANYPPTDADSITASAPPTITTATKSQDSTLTGWTKTLAAGAIIRFNIDSVTTFTGVTLNIKVLKT